MEWYTPPDSALVARRQAVNYRLLEVPDSTGETALVAPYADHFAYNSGMGGNCAALIEGLLRLETCAAALDAAIPALWQRLGQTALTVAEDRGMQRVDRLFGLDGHAGMLGALKTHRRAAASDLPTMTGVQQVAFLAALLGLADDLLDADLWSPRGEALPLYLQALGLVILVQGWLGGPPDAREQAAIARHRAFLADKAKASAPSTARVLQDAAQALRC